MHPVTPAGSLAGRANELKLIDGYLRDLARGRGAAVLIEGEPGIGKTALVRVALAAAPTGSCQVFWGTGDELGQEIPLSPFLDAFAVRQPSTNARRTTIAGLLRGEVATDRGADVPAMLAEQLIALTIDETSQRPVFLVIDDLQWADLDSVRLWGRLAKISRQVPLLLVGLTRPVPHREDLLALRRAIDAEAKIQLTALDQSAATELVKCLAGGQPDAELLRLAKGAAGNPLYLTELLAALHRSGGIAVTSSGTARLAAASVPDSLAEAIADRLDFVAAETREVLRAAALLGVEFAVADLTTVLGKAVTEVMPALDEARATGVLTDAGNGMALAFRHPLLREALYAETPTAIRSAWHLDAGHALAAVGAAPDRVARQLLRAIGEATGDSSAPDLSSSGNENPHVSAIGSLTHRPSVSSGDHTVQLERPPINSATIHSAGPVDEWLLEWLVAWSESLIIQAPGVAVELLNRAVNGIPTGSFRQGWLASRLADALYRAGDPAEAERVAERALIHATDPDLLVDLHWTLAQYRIRYGSANDSHTALERALKTPGITAKHRGRLLVLAARTYLNFGDIEAGIVEAHKALAAAEEASDTWATGWALSALAMSSTARGDLGEALPLYDRALFVAETDPALTDLGISLRINKSAALANLNLYEEALATAEKARKLADQVGTTMRLTQAHGMLSQFLFELGHWNDALTEIAIVPENLKESTVNCCELGIAAKISFHGNDPESARRYLATAEPHAQLIEHRPVPPLVLAQSLDLELAGRFSVALSILTAPFEGDPDDLGELEDLFIDAVRLAIKVGDKQTAQSITTQAVKLAEGSEIPSRQANALYCQGTVDRNAVTLLAAAQKYIESGRKLPQAMAFEAAAQVLIEADDRDKARQAFQQAVEIYQFLGAEVDLNRLQAEFRTYGMRLGSHAKHRRAVSGWESLTDAELKVADLVREGLTNPEIAAKLFTSKRTVGTHVSHILKKLNVATRTDIAREAALRTIGADAG